MIMPGTVSSTSVARLTGRTASCAAVIAPSLPADAIPTRFSAGFSISARLRNVRGAVMTMSALTATTIRTLAVVVALDVTVTVRRPLLKLIRRNVSSAGPAGTFSNRYVPDMSVTVSGTAGAPATLTLTVTPGNTAPVSSSTVPEIVPVA